MNIYVWNFAIDERLNARVVFMNADEIIVRIVDKINIDHNEYECYNMWWL